MFRKTLLASYLAAASLSSWAADYYIVVPVAEKQASVANISVTLNAVSIPLAKVNTAYAGFDFKNAFSVTGDPSYSASLASFSASELPAGLSLSSSGVLSGTPTAKNPAGASFQVTASYKTKTGQQVYRLIIDGQYLDAISISTSTYSHTCAVTLSGAVKCWGLNNYGQLGDGTTSDRSLPVQVTGLTSGIASITVGTFHTCAVTTEGAAKCWGANNLGQLGDNSTTQRLVPVQVYALSTGVSSISAGSSHTCAIVSGAAKCWGANSSGQLGNGTKVNSLVPVGVSNVNADVVSIASGNAYSCASLGTGGAKCWGANSAGQLGNNSTAGSSVPVDVSGLSGPVTQVSTGADHTCAVTKAGDTQCWGGNAYGQLGDGTNVPKLTPVTVPQLASNSVRIAVGYYHSCAVTTSGGAKCWGYNAVGELGNNSNSNSLTPVDVSGLTSGVASIASGYGQTCAIMATGLAKCWGDNSSGQLGDNTLTQRKVPVSVQNP